MNIGLKVDDARLLLRLRNGQKRLAYAVVNAINLTAKDIQSAEREAVAGKFTLRKPEFILRQAAVIKRDKFASVARGRFWAEVEVGQKKGLLLPGYEAGADRPAVKGRNVAVPVVGGARDTKQASVPRTLYFSQLAFRRPAGSRVLVGRRDTYLVPDVGVFERVRGSRRGRILYVFAHSMRLSPVLGWIKLARAVADVHFPARLKREVDHTLAFQQGLIPTIRLEVE